MTMRNLLLGAAVLMLSACTTGLAPTPDELLNTPTAIVAPVLDEEVGKLALIQDGRWAFLADDDAPMPEWERGQLVGFGGVDERRRHVFVVLETQRWGAYLQRLDFGPIATERAGSLIPIGHTSPQVLRRWEICVGSGDPSRHACLTEAASGTRWDIYRFDGMRVALPEDSPAATMPAVRAAQLHLGAFSNDLLGQAPEQWVAVPRGRADRPPRSVVQTSPSCKGKSADSTSLTSTRVGDTPDSGSLFENELAAWHAGADAFVDCRGGKLHLAVPGLARDGWVRRDGKYTGPYLPAFTTVELPEATFDDAVAWAGMLGAGDLAAADFFVERIVARSDDSTAFGRDTMQIAVSAGRLEGALRQGRASTSGNWNRETDPRWSLGMLAVDDALGKTREFVKRRSKLEESARRSDDDAVLTAIYWYRSLETLGGTGGLPALENLTDGIPKDRLATLRAAIVWEATRLGTLELAEARDAVALDERGDQFLVAASGSIEPLPCADDCVYDIYGRRFLSEELGKELVDDLTRVGSARWQPGYTARIREPKSAELLVAMLPHANDRGAVEQRLVDFAVDCETDVDQALKLAREVPSAESAAWFLGNGRTAYCDSLSAFVAASKTWLDQERDEALRRKPLVSEMVDRRLRNMTDGVKMAAGAAYLAELGATDEACETWNVALGVAHLRADRSQEANRFTETALSCTTITGASTRLAAFINFDRTRTISNDFEPDVRQAVSIASRSIVPGETCIGTLADTWYWAPIVTPAMEKVVLAIEVEPLPNDDFQLATASRTLRQATATRAEIAEAMKRGDAAAVHEALNAMERDYAAIGFVPGMKRAAFVRSHLVGPAPAEGDQPQPPGRRDPRAAAWADLSAYIAGDNADPTLSTAASFLVEPADAWSKRVDALPSDARVQVCGELAPEP
jgi:hypothetical protein